MDAGFWTLPASQRLEFAVTVTLITLGMGAVLAVLFG